MRRCVMTFRCMLALSFFLVACDSSPTSTASLSATVEGTTQSAKAQMSPLDLGGGSGETATAVRETLHVVVVGGPRAGTYDKSTTNGGCSYGLAGADSFGNQYTDPDETSGLSSLQVVVPSSKEAATRTSRFNASFTFGGVESDNRTIYEVEGRGDVAAKGQGTVTVADNGQKAQVMLHALPATGIVIDATIDCQAILRVNR